MPEVTAPYPAGTPCWVSLQVPDQQAALDFYRDLFGWSGTISPPETGGYTVCMWHGKAVAGIGESRPMGNRPAPPTAWTTFLAADDADATARAVTGNGGTVLMPPEDVPGGAGRMFVAADPSGAVFGVWQPMDFFGAEIVNEPGSLVWNELNSRDPDASAAFYPRTLGVSITPYKEFAGYFTVNVQGRPVGGMQRLGESFPPGTPSHWLTYFAVDDVDSTVDALVKANGSVLAAPYDMGAGRMAVVADPQGGVFAVIAQPPSA
jgi:uncharacterized protein